MRPLRDIPQIYYLVLMKPLPLKPASYLFVYFFLIATIACQKTGARSPTPTGTGTKPPDSSTTTVYCWVLPTTPYTIGKMVK
jgi:hypothetical protein